MFNIFRGSDLILIAIIGFVFVISIFIDNPHLFFEVINHKIIADEVVRTLVGSIGLVLAVPVTTIFASFAVIKKL